MAIAANSSWNIVTLREGLIRGLRAAGYDPIVIAPRDDFSENRIKGLGVERIIVHIDRSGTNPLADLRLLLSYRKILARLSPAAFLGFTIKPNIYGCIAARLQRIPAIANVSGLGTVFVTRGPLMRVVMAMYRFALKRAAIVFFQNEDDLELFASGKIIRREQARLIPGSGVDLDRFSPSPLPAGPPKFLMIARLLRDKGVHEFVEAARRLRLEVPDARFQLLGPIDEGNPTAIGQRELDQWISEGVVDYLGVTDDVRPFVTAATAVVLPTKYREGVPRSLLEGAAMARPLISTDMPGVRDLVVNGATGLLCRPGSVGSLTDAMMTFIRMPLEQRCAMAGAARAMVEQRFGEERVVRSYVEALESLAVPNPAE